MFDQGESMIIDEELFNDKNTGVWTMIACICDYCRCEFERSKRNIKVGRTIILKESCNSKDCASQKRRESQLKKYGVENFGGTKESLERSKKTCMEKYGVDNAAKHEVFKEKQKKSCKKKYGKSSFLATDSCRESLRESALSKYGVDNYTKVEEIKEKIRNTCLEKYGYDHARKNEQVKLDFFNLFMEKHGVRNPAQLPDHNEKRESTCLKKYGVPHPLMNADIQSKVRNTCLERYGKYPVNRFGKTEENIKEFVTNIGFENKSNRDLLEGKEIDIWIKDKKIGIEYCGLFWHNEISKSDKNYHYDKFRKLQSQGIQLITIFEDEWIEKQNICESIISSKLGVFDRRIFARKCSVQLIDKSQARAFLDQHHLQGSGKIGYACGLFHHNELVGCAAYGRHHRQNHDELVISRFCTSSRTQIIGGISKMFAFIKKQNHSKKIITWSDNRWSNGDIYKKIGFKLDAELGPDYSYYKYGSFAKRKSKQSMKKSNTGCPKNITEHEWCLNRGYVRIWDCGKKRWSWTST